MDLNLQDKDGFIQNFLKPINRFSETAILKVSGNEISCLVSSIDNTTVLYSKYMLASNVEEEFQINVPNIDKLVSSLKIIDDNEVSLKINSNNIQYKSNNIKFRFHLFEDGILTVPKLNLDKINAFEYDVNFLIESHIINQLVKSSSIAGDVNKVYLYTQENNIYAELTDRTIDNSDMFTFCVVDNYNGPPITEPIPLMLDAVRSFSALNLNTDVSINNEYGIVQFKITTNQSILQYIVTSVVA
jgi:hypothetical protein